MKNRGFGIINMFFFMAIFIVLLIVVSIIVNNSSLDAKNTSYKDNELDIAEEYDYKSIENDLKTAASLYQKDYYPDFNDDGVMYVTSKKLIALDYLNILTDGEVSCNGYAKISYDNVVSVTPFIKCGNYYMSEGYSSDLAE